MRRAMIYGSVMASFNVEKFGTERVDELTHEEINQRFADFKRLTHFEEIPFERATSRYKKVEKSKNSERVKKYLIF